MRKKTKHGINSGGSFKFGCRTISPHVCYYIIKYMRNEHTINNTTLPGRAYEETREAIYSAVNDRIDDGGLLEGLTQHQNGFGAQRNQYRILKDELITYSLKKRKRWQMLPSLRAEIERIREEECATIGDSYAPKHMVSLLEGKLYGDRKFWASTQSATCVEYHDTQLGHVKSAHAYSYFQSLKQKAENKLNKEKSENTQDKKKKKKTFPGHNQHFRDIQRRDQLVRPRKKKALEQNNRYDTVEVLPEVRYEVITERARDAHKQSHTSRCERTIYNAQGLAYYTTLRPTRALCKAKGMLKARMYGTSTCGFDLRHDKLVADSMYEYDNDFYDDDNYADDYAEELDSNESWAERSSKPSVVFEFGQLVDNAIASSAQNTAAIETTQSKRTRWTDVSYVNALSGNPVRKNSVIYVPNHTSSRDVSNVNDEPRNSNTVNAVMEDARITYSKYFDLIANSYTIQFELDSIAPKSLEREFTESYSEGYCRPRKFMIYVNVTEHASRKLHMLFECVGQDDSMDCIAVDDWQDLLDNASQQISVRLEGELTECERTACEAVMCDAQNYVTTPALLFNSLSSTICNNDHSSHGNESHMGTAKKKEQTIEGVEANKFSTVGQLLNWETRVFTQNEARDVVQYDPLCAVKQKPKLKKLHSTSVVQCDVTDEQQACDICLESFVIDKGRVTHGAALLPCQHWFCMDCWRHHLLCRVMHGDLSLQCPGFECDHVLDHVTLLSLVGHILYDKHWAHVQDTKIDRGTQWQWCPHNYCGKVARARVDGKDPLGGRVCVDCVCRKVWCFDCQKEAHWPAPCHVYASYMQAVNEHNERKLSDDVIYVKVKKCPQCKYPINKNGGCQYMACRCGCRFCWECLTVWDQHSTGYVCGRGKIEETSIRLEDEINLRMNEYIQSLAIKFRDLRVKLNYSSHRNNFRRLVLKEQAAHARQNIKCSKRAAHIDQFIAQHLAQEEQMFADVSAFVYETYHVLEYSLAAMSQTPRKRRAKLVHRIQDLTLFVNAIEQMLNTNKIETSVKEYVTNMHSSVQRAKLVLDVIPKNITRVQQQVNT